MTTGDNIDLVDGKRRPTGWQALDVARYQRRAQADPQGPRPDGFRSEAEATELFDLICSRYTPQDATGSPVAGERIA